MARHRQSSRCRDDVERQRGFGGELSICSDAVLAADTEWADVLEWANRQTTECDSISRKQSYMEHRTGQNCALRDRADSTDRRYLVVDTRRWRILGSGDHP